MTGQGESYCPPIVPIRSDRAAKPRLGLRAPASLGAISRQPFRVIAANPSVPSKVTEPGSGVSHGSRSDVWSTSSALAIR